jgi:carboxypeptidase Taq
MLAKVQPTFVRVGADELTYNLHILIRFELEFGLLTKTIAIADLPQEWNDRYEAYLGIRPSTDTEGCLQDVHWTRGSVGYFPTYAMGNLIGAQIWKCLQNELGDTDELMRSGDFAPILSWLTEKVYRHGKRFTPSELVQNITGRTMESADWLEYATRKYRALYAL